MADSIKKYSFALFAGLIFSAVSAQAMQIPQFLDIARHDDDLVKTMKYIDAIQYCADQGARLPTAREYAHISMNYGSEGIIDSCGPNRNCYKVAFVKNPDGMRDDFFFSTTGYQPPAGELGTNIFWSSSVDLTIRDIAFVFDGSTGKIGSAKRHRYFAVLCVVD